MKPPTSILKSKTKKIKIKVKNADGTSGRIIELGDGQKRIFRSAHRNRDEKISAKSPGE